MLRTLDNGVAGDHGVANALARVTVLDAPAMSIRVVVPAYNAAGYIGKCLKGLFDAGFTPAEIALVDDGSTDRTSAIAREMGVEPIILPGNSGAAAARNAGARRGAADIIFFVDADVVVHGDVKTRLLDFFATHPAYAAVFGAYDDDPEVDRRVSRFRNLLHRFVHVQGAGDAETFWTGCGAVRREAYERVGGLDDHQAMMEDVKFGMALRQAGERIRIDPRIQGKHLKHWTLPSMCRTDLFHRAIPWARLLRSQAGQASKNALNLGAAGKVSGLAVAGSLAALPLLVVHPAAGAGLLAASVLALIAANSGFLNMLRVERGLAEAAGAVPLLWLHYLCACLGFAWVLLRG